MAAPAIGVRRRWAPPASARIDYSHPLTSGLFCLRGPYGFLTSPPGAATQQLRVKNGTMGPGFWGPSAPTSDSVPGFQTGDWTYLAAVTPLAVSTMTIIVMAEAPVDSTTDRQLALFGGVWVGYLYDGTQRTATGTTAAVIGKTQVVAVTATSSALTVYVDGKAEATQAVSNSGYAGYTTPDLVFGVSDDTAGTGTPSSGFQMDASVHIAGVWRRALTAKEISMMAADPFQFMRS